MRQRPDRGDQCVIPQGGKQDSKLVKRVDALCLKSQEAFSNYLTSRRLRPVCPLLELGSKRSFGGVVHSLPLSPPIEPGVEGKVCSKETKEDPVPGGRPTTDPFPIPLRPAPPLR